MKISLMEDSKLKNQCSMPVLKVDIQHHGIKPDVHSENIRNQNSTIEETQFAFSVSVPLS